MAVMHGWTWGLLETGHSDTERFTCYRGAYKREVLVALSQDYLLYQAVTSTLKAGPFPRGHEHGRSVLSQAIIFTQRSCNEAMVHLRHSQ